MDHRNKGKPPGISPSASTGLSKKDQEMVAELVGRVAALEITVNDKSQWNNMARGWVGKQIRVHLLTEEIVVGELRALDRYTLVVYGEYFHNRISNPSDIIIHKGAIATIQRYQ